ncbi:hypothetical protein ABT369_49800 [Dactylosporangium sp. NPDC000244]|uniref:hypothetical protein n=1 Tax=Dactylosporangium sp. NPDC000244 TaxID=3154365 RepID=UPI0033187014
MLGAATLVYGALVAASLAGGPLKPQQLVPFPDLVNNLPVLDEGQPVAQPGAKNTPTVKKSPLSTAKKINPTGQPAQGGPLPVPSGTVPGGPGPGTTTTTPPPAEATDAPPTTQPSSGPTTQPTPTPTKTKEPTTDPTTAQPTPRTSEAGTALPGEIPTIGATPTRSAGTVPVGETSAGLPGATPLASSVSGEGSTGTIAAPSTTASLGPA